MPQDKAMAVIRKELSLPCPRCSAVIEVTEPVWPTILKARIEEVDETVREAFRTELARRPKDRHI
jgi:hypothetical protein